MKVIINGKIIKENEIQKEHVIIFDNKIIDIALKYGYDSPVSFARAFSNLHGITPKEAKKSGINLKSYPRISFKISIKGVEEMNYRIEKSKAFKLHGVTKNITMKDGQNFVIIPKFWEEAGTNGSCDKLMAHCSAEDKAIYGVCYNFKTDDFDYMIGVNSGEENIDGCEVLNVPELTWVKFECRGKMPDAMQNVWKRIFTEWLPTSGYMHDDGPEIEWYSEGDPNGENYLSEIWIPIKKAN